MSIITKTDNGIIYKLKDELVCIEAYGRDIIRVRITRNSTLSDEKWTLLDVEDYSFETEITEGKASVTSGILRSEICDLPWGAYMLSFYKNCSLILRTHEEGEYTSKFEHTDGQNYRTRIIFDARDDEHFYGLGQEQQENFDKKYCSFDLKHWNTKSEPALCLFLAGLRIPVEQPRNRQSRVCKESYYLVGKKAAIRQTFLLSQEKRLPRS